MIVWLNGPFGAGKSTLAAGLNTALSGSVIADPEDIGALLRQSMAGHHRQQRDYQDYPAWRHLTVRLVAELHQLTTGPVIIPMTILNEQYARKLHTPLSQLGTDVHHLVLHADRAPLTTRTNRNVEYPGNEERSEAVRAHRHRRALDYEHAATAWLHAGAHVIDTSTLTPGQTLQAALAHLHTTT
ncbi:AAA family ATPase [Streptomyces sp. NPDC054904]|uniref:AAA family ATPase n=1 Tax=Streptomyces sp. DK15 TaxID=2957499 RepID=UPI0029B178FD|nr:AAA family ATPase [Streptomyces sp. DK15]MDX2394061.1 ATP-binding protein [Streptomyces sp. DK15]